jgi:hypothetical protein
MSESAIGWLVGVCTSLIAYSVMSGKVTESALTKAAGIVLLLAFNETASNYLPTHDWEARAALAMSGQAYPHRRAELHVRNHNGSPRSMSD